MVWWWFSGSSVIGFIAIAWWCHWRRCLDERVAKTIGGPRPDEAAMLYLGMMVVARMGAVRIALFLLGVVEGLCLGLMIGQVVDHYVYR